MVIGIVVVIVIVMWVFKVLFGSRLDAEVAFWCVCMRCGCEEEREFEMWL